VIKCRIISNGDEWVFSPASFRPSRESMAGANSGRTDDGTMKINWKARLIPKFEIQLPPYKLDDPEYACILSLVQGQEYTMIYYDEMKKDWATGQFYTSNTASDWYSGVLYNGVIQGCSFNAISMVAYYKVDATHPVAPLPPHILPTPSTPLTAPVISLNGTTVSWSAVTHATSYSVYDNGTYYGVVGTTYTISTSTISHNIKVQAIGGEGYSDSDWSNTVSYIPSTGVEYWAIHWDDGISFFDEGPEDEDEDEPTNPYIPYDVQDQSLTVDFVSNNQQFTSLGPDTSNEHFAYNGMTVCEGSGDSRGWNYINPNYQDIIVYTDPTTTFTGDWLSFLMCNTYNGTTTPGAGITHYSA